MDRARDYGVDHGCTLNMDAFYMKESRPHRCSRSGRNYGVDHGCTRNEGKSTIGPGQMHASFGVDHGRPRNQRKFTYIQCWEEGKGVQEGGGEGRAEGCVFVVWRGWGGWVGG